MEHTAKPEGLQVSTELSMVCEGCLEQFLAPLLLYLDQFLDKRLVRTLAQLVRVIIVFRHNRQGLLLSELGGYLLSPAHAPAGAKRISNLRYSPRWSYHVLERFLWRRAEQQWAKTGQDVLAVWDESVLEKPESETLEGLCAVRSSRAARLKHIRPGFYNPPGDDRCLYPACSGWGCSCCPTRARRCWPPCAGGRGAQASDRRSEELHLFGQCAQAWGPRVLHVCDRGFAGSPWLTVLLDRRLRFVLRWPKRYTLLDEYGQRRPAWQIARGRRTWGQRQLQDTHRRQWRTTGVLAISAVTLTTGNNPGG
jgi:hypothetical protein